MKKPKTRQYGEYLTVIDGKQYAVVRLPLGNGKYKRKVKLLSLIGGTKADAIKWAWAELDKKTDLDAPDHTFQSLTDWYKEEYLVPPVYQKGKRLYGLRTWKHNRTVLDRLCTHFGGYKLKNLTVDVLRRYKRQRLASVSIAAVNRDFALMRPMMKAAKYRHWIDENPFESGENLIETSLESHRESPLTERIAKRLLARSRKSEQPLLHYLILVLMHTGARPSEVHPFHAGDDDVKREPLIWQNVTEFDFRAIRLISYKGRIRKERIVPASIELEKGLRRLYRLIEPKTNDLLFPVTTFKRSWKTLCKSARVTDIRLRDFRHYYNSVILLRPDINDMERMLLLGHTKFATNARYSQLDKNFVDKFRNESDSIN